MSILPEKSARAASALALTLALFMPSCATVVGTSVAPVTSAVGMVRHHRPDTWYGWAVFPFAMAGGVLVGTALAPAIGAWADYGAVTGGRYGADGHPSFDDALDPLGAR